MPQKVIKISVQCSKGAAPGEFKELYRNSVICKDGSFDYSLVERALMLLYPNSFIQFTISLI